MSAFDFGKLPEDATLAAKIVDAHVKDNEASKNNGYIGSIFGGKDNISYNISSIIILFCVIIFVPFAAYLSGSSDFTHKDFISSVTGLITLFAGYMFGKSGKKE